MAPIRSFAIPARPRTNALRREMKKKLVLIAAFGFTGGGMPGARAVNCHSGAPTGYEVLRVVPQPEAENGEPDAGRGRHRACGQFGRNLGKGDCQAAQPVDAASGFAAAR